MTTPCEGETKRFFAIEIKLPGDANSPFDPAPILEAVLRDMKANDPDTINFYEHRGQDVVISTSASWPLAGRLL